MTTTTTLQTRTLHTPQATLAYDIRGPLPSADGRPPLMMVGAPMDASGFAALAPHFSDRTVVTYDPRGLGRSSRQDGSNEHTPEQNADDMHRIIAELGVGPVEMLASSGGAVSALALVSAHPHDVSTLVAHEPPLLAWLPDAGRAFEAERAVQATYHAKGWGHGMAAFIALTSWRGELTDEFNRSTRPDPATFGLPSEDDGSRDDPLLSGDSNAITAYVPDLEAIAAARCRVVVAYGIESEGLLTGRTAVAAARALGQEPAIFPSHHGGFMGGEFGYAGEPEAFATRLREVLD